MTSIDVGPLWWHPESQYRAGPPLVVVVSGSMLVVTLIVNPAWSIAGLAVAASVLLTQGALQPVVRMIAR